VFVDLSLDLDGLFAVEGLVEGQLSDELVAQLMHDCKLSTSYDILLRGFGLITRVLRTVSKR
jgi:hypothetical protein